MGHKALIARLRALESVQHGGEPCTGLEFLRAVLRFASVADVHLAVPRTEADVIAVDVGPVGHGTNRTRVARHEGESLAELEARANPAGCWRAAPSPVFADGPAYWEWPEVVWIHLQASGGSFLCV